MAANPFVIIADLAPAHEALSLFVGFDPARPDLPAHLREELKRIERGEGEALWQIADDSGDDFIVAPTPRLLSLIANLRAGGFLSGV